MNAESDRVIPLGEICGIHGVRGWVKVFSFTDPRSNLLDYSEWILDLSEAPQRVRVEASRDTGKNLLAKLEGIDDRDQAQALIGTGVCVNRDELPPCAPGEYYWADLEGLEVVSTSGEVFGRVSRLYATGANDVLALDGPGNRMIPFVPGNTVIAVEPEAGRIVVDWQSDYWD